jgi:hypothetical protein
VTLRAEIPARSDEGKSRFLLPIERAGLRENGKIGHNRHRVHPLERGRRCVCAKSIRCVNQIAVRMEQAVFKCADMFVSLMAGKADYTISSIHRRILRHSEKMSASARVF